METYENNSMNVIDVNKDESITNNDSGLQLELGDIIQILSPTNNQYHNQTYYITYIDKQKIKLLNISNFQLETLLFDSGVLTDESIIQITLLSRSENKGYARQNDLLPKTWVDIHFGGELPGIITGEITNLEEDMIEIRIYPDNTVIYIDFEYKGIPEHIPIKEINIRDPPSQYLKPIPEDILVEQIVAEEEEEATQIYTENGESIIHIPDGAEPEENIKEVLHEIYLNANELFGQDLEEVFQKIEISEDERRYGLEKQLNDLTDELLSTVPISKRSNSMMNKIHNLVERFKQMRELYSSFDKNGNIKGRKVYGEFYKPLVDHIINLDKKLNWLIPVVSQNKKLYETPDDTSSLKNNNENDYTIYYDTSDLANEKNLLNDYKSNKSIGDTLKYENYYTNMFNGLTPFNPPIKRDDFLAFNKSIATDIETIVNNYGDFNSTVISKFTTDHISSTKYLIQKYNIGYTRPSAVVYNNDKKVYVRTKMTQNDSISVKSLIVMPHSFTTYSRTFLPGTSILEKANLSNIPVELFRVFNKKREIQNFNVDDLKVEIDYEKLEEEKEFTIFNEITNFVLDEKYNDDETKYQQFLNSIIPKIRTLIRIIRKNIKGNLSFIRIIQQLEQYMIYPDNITYGQYNEIRFFIKQRLLEMKADFSNKFGQFNAMKNMKFNIVHDTSKLKKILKEDDVMNQLYETQYKREDIEQGSSELMHNIIKSDKGQLFSSLISSIMLTLVTPNKILDAVNMPNIEDDSDNLKKNDCVKRFLAKKYKSIDELQKDNQSEIYVDNDLDDTPYGILDKYKNEKESMLPEKFLYFLAENLVQKHDCPRSESIHLAETLINKKKKVSTGDFAMVELKPVLPKGIDYDSLSDKEKKDIEIEANARTKYNYYRRVKDHWVQDSSIDDTTFIDTNKLFCNIDFKCIKNTVSGSCDPLESKEIMMKRLQYKRAVEEFDKRFDITVDELKKELENALNENLRFIKKQRILQESLINKSSYISYELGKYYIADDSIKSPYLKLRDLILSQDDFTKKQQDIVRLVNDFAREALPEQKEDFHWYYCKETNTKLFPRSLYELAQAYIEGDSYKISYVNKLEELSSSIGEISDDGDAIIDKHSGYVLQKRDLVAEEKYTEEGFHITTNSIIEKDIGVVAEEILKKREERMNKEFTDAITNTVYKVFNAICDNMYIDPELIEPFVIRFSVELINNKKVVLTEDAYNRRVEKLMKDKEKSQPPFTTYKNQSIIIIVACCILVAIQVSIPSINPKKTFSGCVRSFSGYPMGGIEDTTGIKYIACVVKGTSSSIKPWDSIQKLGVTLITKYIRESLERYIVQNNEIIELYLKKREFIVLNPENNGYNEHSISKWVHFLPSVVEYTLSGVQPSSSELGTEFLQAMKRGHHSQRELLNSYKSKNILHTYALVENINNIVKEKDLLLKTSAKVPFLENACCNEDNKSTHPITYFINNDKTIDLHIKTTRKNELIINDAIKLARPDILYNDEFTGILKQELGHQLFEENIYQAFIHYCNFDNDAPIPYDIIPICPEKMKGYDNKVSLKDKIYFLKSHGKKFDEAQYYQLMNIVNSRNRFSTYKDKPVFAIQSLTDLLGSFSRKDFTIIEEPLRVLLQNVLDTYNPMIMIAEGDKSQTPFLVNSSRLKSYLIKTNNKMHKQIMEFIDAFGNIDKNQFDELQNYMIGLTKWSIDNITKNNYYDEALFTITQFIKNNIFYLTRVVPGIIINNVENIRIHSHWGFAESHIVELEKSLKSQSIKLEKFKSISVVKELLLKVNEWSSDINLFIHNIPIITGIHKEGLNYFSLFDKATVYLLFQYIWYSVIYEYTQMCDNVDLIQKEINDNRSQRRENYNTLFDSASNIKSGRNEDLGPDVEEYENELEDVEIRTGNVIELKGLVAELLITIIQGEKKNRSIIDMTYEDISKRVSRTKLAEKKSFTDFFENLSKDRLKIEKDLKKYKLGRWSIGLDDSVFKYDKDNYEKNKDINLLRSYDEYVELGIVDEDVERPLIELDDMSDNEEQEAINEYDAEGLDITGLDNNYKDGVYYEEDKDDDDFGDD